MIAFPRHARPAALVLATLTLSCGGGGGGFNGGAAQCTADYAKSTTLALSRSWYLYRENIPANVDLAQYTGASPRAAATSLLDALTLPAREAHVEKDGWSYITSAASSNQFFGEGQSLGFGIGLALRAANGVDPCPADANGVPTTDTCRLFLRYVFRNAPAGLAGFARGDEILALGPTAATLEPVGPLIQAGTLGQKFNSGVQGTTRVFSVVPVAGGPAVERTATTAVYTLDPVFPNTATLITLPGSSEQVGYVGLRSFISTAEAPLLQAFAAFQAANVRKVIVDLRYNGGGLVSIAELFSNLLGGGRAGQLMFTQEFNSVRGGQNGIANFAFVSQAIPATKIAFIMNEDSASASELVANALEPYAQVAIIGERSYGKPLGQAPQSLAACNDLLYIIAFRLRNAQGDAGYFDGLPFDDGAGHRFNGPLCLAADGLAHPQGDVAEPATATALAWLAGTDPQACPTQITAARVLPKQLARSERAGARAIIPPEPTVAQRELPGLF